MSFKDKLKKAFKREKKTRNHSNPNSLLNSELNSLNQQEINHTSTNQNEIPGTSSSANFSIEIDSSLSSNSTNTNENVNIRSLKRNSNENVSQTSQMNSTENTNSLLPEKVIKERMSLKKLKNTFSRSDKQNHIKNKKQTTKQSNILVQQSSELENNDTSQFDSIIESEPHVFSSSNQNYHSRESEEHTASETDAVMHIENTSEIDTFSVVNEDSFIEEKKDIEMKHMTDFEICSFISNPSSRSTSTLSVLSGRLNDNNVVNLYRDFAYNECVLYFAIVQQFINGSPSGDIENLLSLYDDLNLRRLQDKNLYNLLVKKSSEILSIKDKLDQILKDNTKNCLKCIICQKENVSILFLPCGHIVLCNKCHNQTNDCCKTCGNKVDEFHQIYL